MKASELLQRVVEKMKEKQIPMRAAIYESYDPQLTSEERGQVLRLVDSVEQLAQLRAVEGLIVKLIADGR